MAGCVSRILLRSPVPVWRLGEVEAILRSMSLDVRTTRKARSWHFSADPSEKAPRLEDSQFRQYRLDLAEPERSAHEWEDDLLPYGLLFDDVPQAFVLFAPSGDAADRVFSCKLMAQLASHFDGIDLGLVE